MSRGADRPDASTAAQQVVSLRRWYGHDVIRVDVDADRAGGDLRWSRDERGDILRGATGRVPRRLLGAARIVVETDPQVPAITGIHEQIFLEARDSADDRHESGLESSRCL